MATKMALNEHFKMEMYKYNRFYTKDIYKKCTELQLSNEKYIRNEGYTVTSKIEPLNLEWRLVKREFP